MAILIKTNGEKTEVHPNNGADFKLEELQGSVGGYIQLIHLADGRILVCNEEGRLLNLSVNHGASEVIHEFGVRLSSELFAFGSEALCITGAIVGDVVICNDNEFL